MRRVIVEQIDALAELNRIVARHSRDTVEPARRAEPVAASGGATRPRHARRASRSARPARFEEPRPARPEPAAAAAPGTGAPRRAEPAAPEGASRRLADRPARPRRARGAGAARAATSGRRAAPWSRSTRLSVDIARMIDHDAAAELWERYKRGERNVFTRRLYTMQGQQTFEEIRKRYRADREFRQTVDRYIGEFERLLEEVSQGERGQATARSYLTSDTGKVYTMLAHAAGRFE